MLLPNLSVAGLSWLSLFCFAESSALLGQDNSPSHKHGSRKPHPIPKVLYHKFQKYTNYTSASIHYHYCPNPPYGSKIVDSINTKKTDTQGTIFRNDKDKEFIVSFPGTNSNIDARFDRETGLVPYKTIGVTNETCPGCEVGLGFYTEWQAVAAIVSEKVHHYLKSEPSYKLTVTGHSLGATLASLCTSSLRGQGFHFKTYTSGEPRVGNKAYADHIDKISGAGPNKVGHYHRVTHANDGVPHYPERKHGYQHSRTEYWEMNTKNGGQSAAKTVRCYGQEPDNCNNAQVGHGVDPAHHMYSGIVMQSHKSCGYRKRPNHSG